MSYAGITEIRTHGSTGLGNKILPLKNQFFQILCEKNGLSFVELVFFLIFVKRIILIVIGKIMSTDVKGQLQDISGMLNIMDMCKNNCYERFL